MFDTLRRDFALVSRTSSNHHEIVAVRISNTRFFMLIDAHCHLDHLGLAGAGEFLSHLSENNLKGVIVCGLNAQEWEFYADLAKRYPALKFCCGLYPLELSEHWERNLEQMRAFLSQAVGIGEIGLDFHGIFDTAHIPQMKLQMKVFERQLRLAQFYELPVVIHCRDAFFAIKEILQYTRFDLKKVMFHCFVEDLEAARWVTDNGGLLSYSGVITFKRFGHTHETAIATNLSQIVVETDSPYLTPAPFRGQQNFPTYVHYVAEKLAELKQISFDECTRATTENAKRFFEF